MMIGWAGEDTFFVRDQSTIAVRLVEELLDCGTGPNGDLTPGDLSRISSKRRAESKKHNPQFLLTTFHKFFGSSKYVSPSDA